MRNSFVTLDGMFFLLILFSVALHSFKIPWARGSENDTPEHPSTCDCSSDLRTVSQSTVLNEHAVSKLHSPWISLSFRKQRMEWHRDVTSGTIFLYNLCSVSFSFHRVPRTSNVLMVHGHGFVAIILTMLDNCFLPYLFPSLLSVVHTVILNTTKTFPNLNKLTAWL